jgi:hypothetical protein
MPTDFNRATGVATDDFSSLQLPVPPMPLGSQSPSMMPAVNFAPTIVVGDHNKLPTHHPHETPVGQGDETHTNNNNSNNMIVQKENQKENSGENTGDKSDENTGNKSDENTGGFLDFFKIRKLG